MMNTHIFLVQNPTLVRIQQVLHIFKHVVGSLVDLFNSCQPHISYARHVKLFLGSWIKENVCHYFPGDMRGRGYNEKSD